MLKVDFLLYRDWAHKAVVQTLALADSHAGDRDYHVANAALEVRREADVVFLVGWSDIVPRSFYEHRTVLVIHPSALPEYRGGSPIQHQIMAGLKFTDCTLFKLDPMYPGVDSGPIAGVWAFSLEGSMSEVLANIADAAAHLMASAIRRLFEGEELRNRLQPAFQPDGSAWPVYKRRTPAQSELWDEEVSWGGLQTHNFVRALQDPYPNAFIDYPDGRLYITGTRWEPFDE